MDKTEHHALPAVVNDYIDAVINTMRYRKTVRQEVRRELAAHFADALADCKDDHERNEQAKELIEAFGDAKLLGTLLRRAKKRCRPLWRTMVVRAFQAVGVLVVLLIAYVGWFLTGKPVITTNYVEKMNTIVRPVADDALNAWPYYKQAAEKFVAHEDKEFDFSPHSPKTLTNEQRTVILDAIAKNQESFALIHQGNQKPYYWQTYGTGEKGNTEMLTVLLPHLADYRQITRLLCWQALFHAEKGEMAAAFDTIVEVHHFGCRLRGQHTTLIEQLVAIAVEAMSMDTTRMALDSYGQGIDAELLASVCIRLEEQLAKQNFIVSFESEKLMIYDELQRCFTQSRFGRSHLYLPRLNELGLLIGVELEQVADQLAVPIYWFSFLAVLHPTVFAHPDREQTRQTVDVIYDEMSRLAAQTPASLHKQGVDIDQRVDEIGKGNLFSNLLASAVGKVTQLGYRCQADSFATLAILAIMQYHKLHGVYPDSLDALVQAGLLSALPIDPFSDAPLVYRKTNQGFTLYSVGLNFTDDGGVPGTVKDGKATPWAEDGDAVFWPVQKDRPFRP